MISCWNCEHSLNLPINPSFKDFFCHNCYKVQEIKEVSCFSLLEIKQNFEINKEQLEKNYFLAQSLFHPDKYTNNTIDEQLIATENSATINQCFNTLGDDFFLAKYLLELAGINKQEFDKVSLPLEKLDELIEIKETLSEYQDSETINSILVKLEDDISHLKIEFNELFRSGKISEASVCVAQWQYINRIIENR